MTTGADLLVDAFGRVQEAVHAAVSGLTVEALNARLDADANSIAWLVWHLTRVQDDHIAEVADVDQVYLRDGFAERFSLPLDQRAIGYGHTSDEVAAVRVEDPQLLLDYYDAVHRQTVNYVKGLTDTDFDRIVDRSWDPAVTLAVRLVSVVNDTMMHVGQAQFVRGVLDRRS
ncbi:DUF664 domain-containing protein [Actinospica sp. MGRD01-02]|uniref:DUF664 domain-containing protein n=1 Tax=Actinospica acidithermotolerans TaxID=2828514 RepID=A0A941EEE1_9ACTN|nr:DinB family protein [Actinospica acidithermotolerans]MBR7827529.1 DUF664 domain-containing protein [Actinospica acidithermotolerans]